MNVLGILGADPEVRNGFESITVRFDIDADASREDIEALVAQSQKRSAVYDIVTNPTQSPSRSSDPTSVQRTIVSSSAPATPAWP